jgi:hypothetical protein
MITAMRIAARSTRTRKQKCSGKMLTASHARSEGMEEEEEWSGLSKEKEE